jgi:hypothetical protein
MPTMQADAAPYFSSPLMTSSFVFPGAMDEEILEALYFVGVPVFNMKSEQADAALLLLITT